MGERQTATTTDGKKISHEDALYTAAAVDVVAVVVLLAVVGDEQ